MPPVIEIDAVSKSFVIPSWKHMASSTTLRA